MVNVQSVCQAASEAQPNQTLAVILSVLFMIYIVVAMLLSGLAILSASSPFLPLLYKGKATPIVALKQ